MFPSRVCRIDARSTFTRPKRTLLAAFQLATILVGPPAAFARVPPQADRGEAGAASSAPLVFATVVGSDAQERHAALLVDSIRRFGGRYGTAPVLVAVDDPGRWPCRRARDLGASILPLEADPEARRLPFSLKVFAAAAAERAVGRRAGTLVWLDPETIVLSPPEALDLGSSRAMVAARPVFLVNTIGLPPQAPPDAFWARIYAETGLDWTAIPAVETVVDRQPVRYYVNCQVVAVRPVLGLFAEWARLYTALANDRAFVRNAVSDAAHRIFLHQAVLSALVLARTKPHERREFPLDHGYPLSQHDRLDSSQRFTRLDQAVVVILENAWQRRPDWTSRLPADGALGRWVTEAARWLLEGRAPDGAG